METSSSLLSCGLALLLFIFLFSFSICLFLFSRSLPLSLSISFYVSLYLLARSATFRSFDLTANMSKAVFFLHSPGISLTMAQPGVHERRH